MSNKRQIEEFKKRVERQMYLAKESPEPVFDLSACSLHEVPSGVFPLCKVLQKESLLLHENKMKHFKSGNFKDLAFIKLLDLHSNLLESIPQEICCLKNLQVLNLENNRLSSLPGSFGLLSSLRQLNLKNNLFKTIPDSITRLYYLRQLDISMNKITTLPKELCLIRTLESLELDVMSMTYPSRDICLRGIASTMKFLCAELRVEYIPSSDFQFSAVSLPTSPAALFFPQNSFAFSFSKSDSVLNNTLQEYESAKEKKRVQTLALEKQLDEDYRIQASLAAQAAANKKDLLELMSQEHTKLDNELWMIHRQKSVERERLIKSIQKVEENTSSLVEKFVEANERARRTEELLDRMERERLEKEQWYIVRQEELRNIRKKDITESFEKMLEHSDVIGLTIKQYLQEQKEIAKKSIDDWEDMNAQFTTTLQIREEQKHYFLERLLKEEEIQKEAFEMLQAERDVCHRRIVSQISLIQQELSELTLLELDRRAFNIDSQLSVLETNRMKLMELLVQLFEERDKREAELKTRLIEMEEMREANQVNYWLVQYQRLLDSKPQSLVDQENNLEYKVVEILRRSNATEFIPRFARQRISIETMLQMDDDCLKEMGVNNSAVRQDILSNIKLFKTKDKSEKTSPVTPTAPLASDVEEASPADSIKDISAECVVCLSEQANVLFLNCGHICTCSECSKSLTICPMDRLPISQKIKIFKVTN